MKLLPALDYKKIIAESPVYYSSNLTRKDIDNCVIKMMESSLPTLWDTDPKADKFGTSPVRSSFFILIPPQMVVDFVNAQGFISTRCYPNSNAGVTNEIGLVGNLRVVIVDELRQFRKDPDQYSSIVISINDGEFNKAHYLVVESQ